MFFSKAITITKDTAEADATKTLFKLAAGVITNMYVQFPVGCAGLVDCRILYEGAHLWPTNPDGSLSSDGFIIPIEEEVEILPGSNVLQIVAWNTDDTYDHTITVWVNILRGTAWIWALRVLQGLAKFLQRVGIKV